MNSVNRPSFRVWLVLANLVFVVFLPNLSVRGQEVTSPAASGGAPTSGGATTFFPSADGGAIASQLQRTVSELDRSKRLDAIEQVVERTMRRYANDWRVLFQGARIYAELERAGYWVNQRYRRGDLNDKPPKGARRVFSHQRDHVRALQLLDRAIRLAVVDPNPQGKAAFFWEAAQILTGEKAFFGMYELTDLTQIPTLDFQEPVVPDRKPVPLGEDGAPQFIELPQSWHTARNDGERLLWLLHRARELDPEYAAEAEFLHAKHLLKAYLGVQTLVEHGRLEKVSGQVNAVLAAVEEAVGPLDALSPQETVAVVGSGEIKKFALPDSHNYIQRLEAMARNPAYRDFAALALEELAEVFENRRQYGRAAQSWQALVRLTGGTSVKESTAGLEELEGEAPPLPSWEEARLQQIVRSWGRFEDVQPVQAGEPLSLEYWYRNGREVTFRAHRVDVPALVDDLLVYLKSDPFPIDPDRINVSKMGLNLVRSGGERYLKEKVTEWAQALTPSDKHWDQRIEVPVPIEDPGAYLVEARIDGGHSCSVLVWINDLSILRRPLEDGLFYYVADKREGTPVGWVKFTFVGYRLTLVNQSDDPELDVHGEEVAEALQRQYHVTTKEITKWADAKGQLILDDSVLLPDYRWFLLATAPSDRVAVLGFSDLKPEVAQEEASTSALRQVLLTDRSVYLPGQTCRFRAWARRQSGTFEYAVPAGVPATIVLRNHWDEILADLVTQTDAGGGFVGEFVLPQDLSPGSYRLQSLCEGNVTEQGLLVEPDTVPPCRLSLRAEAGPLKTGEPWKLRLRSLNESGQALGETTVRYRVVMREGTAGWSRSAPHAWLFGQDYDLGSPAVPWYPGWENWGWPRSEDSGSDPERLVAEGQVVTDASGVATWEVAPEAIQGQGFPEGRLRCEVWPEEAPEVSAATAEVTVSDRAFRVYAKVEQPYYRVGEEIVFEAWARDLHGQAVTGQGELVLYRAHFGDERGQPVEWGWKRSLALDAQGQVRAHFPVAEPGQYRASYMVTNAAGERVEGACVFLVVDEGFQGSDQRFNSLEILADKVVYEPGDRVRLRINTTNVGQSVAIFVRPRGGVIGQAEVIRLDQRSTPYELTAQEEDRPSFVVEAIILNEGEFEVHSKEIVVAPPSPVLRTSLTTEGSSFRPGQEIPLTVRLADAKGEPVAGEVALSVTPMTPDGRVEDHRPTLHRTFWKVRRPYIPSAEHGLKTQFQSFSSPPQARMRPIGIFGSVRVGELAAAPPEQITVEELERERVNEIRPYASWQSRQPVLWQPSVSVDASGMATLPLSLPESDGQWKVRAWALDESTRFGEASLDLRVQRDWTIEMPLPSRAVVGDRLKLTARIENLQRVSQEVPLELHLGEFFEWRGEPWPKTLTLEPGAMIPLQGELVALTPSAGAEVELRLGGGETGETRRGKVRIEPRGRLSEVRWDHPFTGGGSEERWEASLEMPALEEVIWEESEVKFASVSEGLEFLALACSADRARAALAWGDVEEALSLGSALLVCGHWMRTLDPESQTQLKASPAGWMWEEGRLVAFTESLIRRVAQAQQPDGGWGGREEEARRALVTATVLEELANMKDLEGVALPETLWERGVNWLASYQRSQEAALGDSDGGKREADTLDALIDLALARSNRGSSSMRERLFRDWKRLSVMGQVLLAQSLHLRGETADRNVVRFALGGRLEEDEEKGRVRLGAQSERFLWEWYGSEDEVQARYLRFLMAIKGDDPVTDGAAKELMDRGNGWGEWGSARATGQALQGLVAYGKLKDWRPDPSVAQAQTLELWSGTHRLAVSELTPSPPWPLHSLEVPLGAWRQAMAANEGANGAEDGGGEALRAALDLRYSGSTPLRVVGRARVMHRPLILPREASPELALRRRYERESDGQAVVAGDRLRVGDILVVRHAVTAERRLGHLVLEDPVPAGFEVEGELPEGWRGSEEAGVKASLPALEADSESSYHYTIRAVREGRFHALPASVRSRYRPEWIAESEETIFRIEARP